MVMALAAACDSSARAPDGDSSPVDARDAVDDLGADTTGATDTDQPDSGPLDAVASDADSAARDTVDATATDTDGDSDAPLEVAPDAAAAWSLTLLTGPGEVSLDGRPTIRVTADRAALGTLTGACARADVDVVLPISPGIQTLALAPPGTAPFPDGAYADCGVRARDDDGTRAELPLPAFVVDATLPAVSEVTPVATPSADPRPVVVLATSKAGTLSWSGGCHGDDQVAGGVVSVDLVADDGGDLDDGSYPACGVSLGDQRGRTSPRIALTTFVVDARAPTLSFATTPSAFVAQATLVLHLAVSEPMTLRATGPCTVDPAPLQAGASSVELLTDAGAPWPDGAVIAGCALVGRDSAGRDSAPLSVPTITIDRTPPSLVLTASPPALLTLGAPSVAVQVSEPGHLSGFGGCDAAADLEAGAATVTLTAPDGSPLPDGAYSTCELRFADKAGNHDNVAVPAFALDLLAPQLTFFWTPPTTGNSSDVYVGVVTDSPCTVAVTGSCTASVGPTPGPGPVSLNLTDAHGELLLQGVYADCQVRATDLYGRISRPLPVPAFTIDLTSFGLDTPVSPTNKSRPPLDVFANEAGSVSPTAGYMLRPAAILAGTSPLILTTASGGPLSDGVHTVTFTFTGAATHGVVSVTRDLEIDTVPPSLELVATDWSSDPPTMLLRNEEPVTMVMRGGCAPDGQHLDNVGEFTVAIHAADGGALPDGAYDCAIAGMDQAGNMGEWQPLPHVLMDHTPPTLTLVAFDGPWTGGAERDVVVAASEPGTVVSADCPSDMPTELAAGTQTIALHVAPGDVFTRCRFMLVDAADQGSSTLQLPPFGQRGRDAARSFGRAGRTARFAAVAELPEGGLIAVGGPYTDGLVMRLDASLEPVWSLQLDGLAPTTVSIRQDLVVVAGTTSYSLGAGSSDAFVLRLDASDGTILWLKAFGLPNSPDRIESSVIFGSGAIALAGSLYLGGSRLEEGWYLQLEPSYGTVEESRVYGTPDHDSFNAVSDGAGGRVLAGSTGPTFDGSDVLVVVTDNIGKSPWAFRYSGPFHDSATAVSSPGGYIAGSTYSFGSSVASDPVAYSGFVMSIDQFSGDIRWQRGLGGSPLAVTSYGSMVAVAGKTPDYGDGWSEGDGAPQDYTEGSHFDGALWTFFPDSLRLFELGGTDTTLTGLAHRLAGGFVAVGERAPDEAYSRAFALAVGPAGDMAGVTCAPLREIPATHASIPIAFTVTPVDIVDQDFAVVTTNLAPTAVAPWLIVPSVDAVCE
ncbi:MAG: hypothetical protein U1F43_37615 [Myxococcota bacterium]